ncbi:MAG: hypothetical protein HY901_35595, partial [Deltaproteobacteria bacterium]|nr:hypothetical protein [Deltaproteobacteria bacterium]
MRSTSTLSLPVALLAGALASLPAAGRASAAPAAASRLEAALLEDAADRRLERFDLLDAALIVSGAHDQSALDSSRAALRAVRDPGLR